MIHGTDCKAGEKGCFIDLQSGVVNRCVFHENIANLYDDNSLDFNAVKNECKINYCFNCHVYAPLGILNSFDCPTYYKIRDRLCSDGTHWIKEEMKRFIDTKII